MKSFHPLFKSAVVGINILDMVNASNDSNASREIDGAIDNSEALSHRPVDGSTITTENGILRQNSPQRRLDFLFIKRIQHEIRCCTRAVAYYQHRHLVFACATRMDLLAAFTRWTIQVALTFAGRGKKVSSASMIPCKWLALVAAGKVRNRWRQRKLVFLSIPHCLALTVKPSINAAL
jgi:hypothetical protein